MLFGGTGQRSHARASQPESLAIPDSIIRRQRHCAVGLKLTEYHPESVFSYQAAGRLRTRLLRDSRRETQDDAEAAVAVPVRRVEPDLVRRPTKQGSVAPTAATQHAVRTLSRSHRINNCAQAPKTVA
jgi:hypothetical protein